MKYYVTSDVHSFYSEFKQALDDKGFFTDSDPKKLIICGDALDRGLESVEMQDFMMDLYNRDELIFIRGNHEDLLLDMLNGFDKYADAIAWGYSHHVSNGTWSSALQLSGMTETEALRNRNKFVSKVLNSDFCKTLIPASIDYYETEHYVFVHGSIPCETNTDMPAHYRKGRTYQYNPNWREVHASEWNTARWFNGMELAWRYDVYEPSKQIVCGHWHCSWGWSHLKLMYKEFPKPTHADWSKSFEPFVDERVIAIDACTAYSKKVNVLVIED